MALHTRAVFFQGVALRGRPGAPPVIASNPPPEGLPGKARSGCPGLRPFGAEKPPLEVSPGAPHPIFSEL